MSDSTAGRDGRALGAPAIRSPLRGAGGKRARAWPPVPASPQANNCSTRCCPAGSSNPRPDSLRRQQLLHHQNQPPPAGHHRRHAAHRAPTPRERQSIEDIRRDLIIPTAKRKGRNPSPPASTGRWSSTRSGDVPRSRRANPRRLCRTPGEYLIGAAGRPDHGWSGISAQFSRVLRRPRLGHAVPQKDPLLGHRDWHPRHRPAAVESPHGGVW